MINLFDETLKILRDNSKTPDDVLWVGLLDRDIACSDVTAIGKTTWEDFAANANFVYDNGFGSIEINDRLVIVGDTWWLERHEYDGSEWWEFKQKFDEPEQLVSTEHIITRINYVMRSYDN